MQKKYSAHQARNFSAWCVRVLALLVMPLRGASVAPTHSPATSATEYKEVPQCSRTEGSFQLPRAWPDYDCESIGALRPNGYNERAGQGKPPDQLGPCEFEFRRNYRNSTKNVGKNLLTALTTGGGIIITNIFRHFSQPFDFRFTRFGISGKYSTC